MNNIINGDCLIELKKFDKECIDLIYLDPPFYTQKKQKLSKKKEDDVVTLEFEDTWDSIQDYLSYMKERLFECKRVLKKTGSIFLHCDRNACHYLKEVMDEVFGENNFQSEIIWAYKRWSNSKKGLLNTHQNIYFYSKSNAYKFNTIYTDYSLTTNIDQILQNRQKDINGITKYQKDSEGNVICNFNKKGVPLSDVWNIPYLNPKAKERNGYPTQKPILLLEQIIKIASDEGDVILDPFCGSGTTLAAAKILNRNYIGIDKSPEAVSLSKKRLENKIIKTDSHLLEKGIEAYNQKNENEAFLIKQLGALPVQRNGGIDAIIPSTDKNSAIAIKFQRETETLDEVINKMNKSCELKQISNKIILKNENQLSTSLFDNILNESNIKIIDSFGELLKLYFNQV